MVVFQHFLRHILFSNNFQGIFILFPALFKAYFIFKAFFISSIVQGLFYSQILFKADLIFKLYSRHILFSNSFQVTKGLGDRSWVKTKEKVYQNHSPDLSGLTTPPFTQVLGCFPVSWNEATNSSYTAAAST